MSQTNNNVVLFACDMEYLPYALFACWQLDTNILKNFDIVIASDDPRVKDLLPHFVQFLLLKNLRVWKQLDQGDRWGYYAYLRLPAIENLCKKYEKVLYLDNDVFISTKAIGEVFSVNMAGYVLAAVRDSQQRFNLRKFVKDFKKNNLPNAPYFNAGVLLIDAKLWKEEKIFKKLIATSNSYKFPIIHKDQTILNLTFHGKWLELSPVWNWMSGPLTNLAGDFYGIRLFHQKSWVKDPRRISQRFYKEFREFNDFSPLLKEKVALEAKNEFIADKSFLKSLIMNLRWAKSCSNWVNRFPSDFSTNVPNHIFR